MERLLNMILFLCLVVLGNADSVGPWNIAGFTGYSGEIIMNATTGSSIFLWQFNALGGNINTDRKPLVIWLQGGPGCSSLLGMLGESICPFYIDANSNPQPSNSTWATNYHLLSIDFPFNSGFSYASQPTDLQNSTSGAVGYLYTFLQIVAGKYNSWFKRDVYFAGEDYAGHFIPAIVSLILTNNLNTNNTPITVKGIAIGDPWADAFYQTQQYDTVLYNLGLVNIQQRSMINQIQNQIYNNITFGNYESALISLNYLYTLIESYSGNVNIYNSRTYNLTVYSALTNWLNLDSTKTTLGVPLGATWQTCNPNVRTQFDTDVMLGFASSMMSNLLSSVKVLIYQSQDDLYVNSYGVNTWLASLNWPYQNNFAQSRRNVWSVTGNVAGYVQTYNSLTYVQLLNAGNQGILSQPFAGKDMINRFILNQGWN